ncbi:MAG: alpha/beta hydrolase family protein [Calditrichaceae bacterium]
MKFERLKFKGSQDHLLSARLDLPDEREPTAYAIFAHCFTCSKNLKAIHNINMSLTAKGIAVLRFDFTGLGESEGDFADTNFSSNVGDLVAAADYLRSNYTAPKILIGHSLGGAAILQSAISIPSSVAVSTIGSPFDPGHVKALLRSTREQIELQGEAEFVLAGRQFRIKKQFLDDLEQAKMDQFIRNLNKALLIFHSPVDNIVGIDNAAKIFMTARHPKSFISLDKADHLLAEETDSKYVGAIIGTWAGMYL